MYEKRCPKIAVNGEYLSRFCKDEMRDIKTLKTRAEKALNRGRKTGVKMACKHTPEFAEKQCRSRSGSGGKQQRVFGSCRSVAWWS